MLQYYGNGRWGLKLTDDLLGRKIPFDELKEQAEETFRKWAEYLKAEPIGQIEYCEKPMMGNWLFIQRFHVLEPK